MATAAAFFDLDKTVIATSSATAFARPFLSGGLLTRRAVLRSAYAQATFLLGTADEGRTERLRLALSRTVTGWEVARVEELVQAHVDRAIRPVLHAEAVERIAAHHAAGEDVVIVSASAAELVRPIARLLGVDRVIATEMSVRDGRYTGEIDFYAYGPAKAVAMRALAQQEGYDLAASSAYTDSTTDAPMLAAVGHGYMVNPDRRLRRWAREQGWESLRFHTARHRADVRRQRTGAVVLVGVALAAIGVGAARRARR
ncbi:HAD-IB family hydrolase [Cellulomonas sp. NPDC089187]|uniref:HAD family hydrolase n=1 Tax=Cellulomonas sp. NPDC089187 TaxID=3154970 RepID=UPI0034419EE9